MELSLAPGAGPTSATRNPPFPAGFFIWHPPIPVCKAFALLPKLGSYRIQAQNNGFCTLFKISIADRWFIDSMDIVPGLSAGMKPRPSKMLLT